MVYYCILSAVREAVCLLFESDGADDECYAGYFIERNVEGRVFLVVGDGGEAVLVL